MGMLQEGFAVVSRVAREGGGYGGGARMTLRSIGRSCARRIRRLGDVWVRGDGFEGWREEEDVRVGVARGSLWDVPLEFVCEVACARALAEASHVKCGAAAARHDVAGDVWR